MTLDLATPSQEEKKITVIWSGGYDSTALLIRYLTEGYLVNTVSARLFNIRAEQTAMETRARESILRLLDIEFPFKIRERLVVDVSDLGSGPAGAFRISQPPIWITLATLTTTTNNVAFGWIKYDDVWHYRQDLLNLATAMNAFRQEENKIILEWPLEWARKSDLLDYFRTRTEIFHNISVCEDGYAWSVCRCKKCSEMQGLAQEMRGPNL